MPIFVIQRNAFAAMFVRPFLEYLLLEKKYSPHTSVAYKSDLSSFLKFLSLEYSQGEEHLPHINYSQIRLWMKRLSEQKISNRTINRKLTTLRTFYRFLLKIKKVPSNPLGHYQILKTKSRIQTAFSEKELNVLLDSQTIFSDNFEDTRDHLVLEMLYATGMRRSELLEIKTTNIDLTEKSVKIIGKGLKERIMPLTDKVLEKLYRYLQARLKIAPTQEKKLFLNKKGKPMSSSTLYRNVYKHLGMVSKKVKKSPHLLRHSFATHLLNNGSDINSVKELMGHSTIASTQHYSHSSLSELKKTYRKAHPRSNQK